MKINSQKEQRTYIIIGLCMILVVMGVGYAAFSSLLTINGTANISNSWCVGFDNTKTNAYVPKAGITGGTTPTGSITFSSRGWIIGVNISQLAEKKKDTSPFSNSVTSQFHIHRLRNQCKSGFLRGESVCPCRCRDVQVSLVHQNASLARVLCSSLPGSGG